MSSDARVPQSVDSTVEAGRRARLLPHLHTLISRRIEMCKCGEPQRARSQSELFAVEWMTRTPSGKDNGGLTRPHVDVGHKAAAADARGAPCVPRALDAPNVHDVHNVPVAPGVPDVPAAPDVHDVPGVPGVAGVAGVRCGNESNADVTLQTLE